MKKKTSSKAPNGKPAKAAGLLPPDADYDGPLFFVIATIVFLACLAAVSAMVSMQNVRHWQSALQSEMTVQIMSASLAETKVAESLLSKMPGIKAAKMASRKEAKQLLEPWLGAKNIPDDLPIPLLIHLQIDQKNRPQKQDLQNALGEAGFQASVDDHQRWAADLARTARMVQLLSSGILAILIAASIAVTGFATRAGLAARRDLVNVLHLVGAKDRTIARLFGRRFVELGFKAGAVGALLAGASLALLMVAGVGASTLLGNLMQPGFGALLLLLPAPLVTALVGGLTAHFSVSGNLRKNSL